MAWRSVIKILRYFSMCKSSNSLNNTKIDTVNTKFATSILTETIKKLNLLHYSESLEHKKDNETDNIAKDTSNGGNTKLKKIATDVDNIKLSLTKLISELELYNSFITDFSGISVAENEYNFLNEAIQHKIIFDEQCSLLNEIEERIANHHKPTDTIDESIIKGAIQSRFIKTWEQARRDQNEHFYRMLTDSLQDEINKYSRKIAFEQRCIVEIENYSLSESEMHKAESVRWSEKFDVDINKTEVDIQISTNELEAMKMNYENTVESIKHRDQEMKDFIALKEERVLQKDSELMKLIYSYKDHLFAKCRIFSED